MATKHGKKSEFKRLREKVGLSRQGDAEKYLEISRRTLQRWDKKGAPAYAMRLLHLYDRRDCAGMGPGWEGFRFSRGRLIHTREKLIFTPERLKLWPGICEKLGRLELEAEKKPRGATARAWEALLRWAGKALRRPTRAKTSKAPPWST